MHTSIEGCSIQPNQSYSFEYGTAKILAPCFAIFFSILKLIRMSAPVTPPIQYRYGHSIKVALHPEIRSESEFRLRKARTLAAESVV